MGNPLAYMPLYVADITVATATWPRDRIGSYDLCLRYQWEHGGVPADDHHALALILHETSRTQAVKAWQEIAHKFVRKANGLYQNERLEEVRTEALNEMVSRSNHGKAGAKARWERARADAQDNARHDASHPAPQMPEHSPGNANQNQIQNQEKKTTPSARANGVQGRGAFEPNALPRDHMKHALCGPRLRLCLSYAEFGKLKAKYGGTDDEARAALEDFVAQLETAVGDGGIGDHLWLLNHFEVFMSAHARVEPAPQSPHRSKPDQFEGMKDFVRNG